MSLFVVEGLDGVGKSTFIKVLKEELEKIYPDREVLVLRPSDEESNKGRIQELISDRGVGYESIKKELDDLFIDSICKLWGRVIIPSLEDGKIIIMDRFIYSSIVYSGNDYSVHLNYFLNSLGKHKQYIYHVTAPKNYRNELGDIIEEGTANMRRTLGIRFSRLFRMLDNVYRSNNKFIYTEVVNRPAKDEWVITERMRCAIQRSRKAK